MLGENKYLHKLSLLIIFGFILLFGYISFGSFFFVKEHQISIDGEIYTNRVSQKPYIQELSNELTKGCKSNICKVQKLLDYVTNIEYKLNPTIAKSPKDTIKFGFGDCDDKSNLLISLLKINDYDVLFATVPNHIFVLIHLEDKELSDFAGLYLDGKKYYILESTAINSKIGFPFQYNIEDIETILEPFKNEKLEIDLIEYKR